MAAPYCHRFNLANKGELDDIQAGDETYIKVKGEHNYVFFLSPRKVARLLLIMLTEQGILCLLSLP